MGVSSLFNKISIPVTFQLTELSLNLIPSLIPTIFALTLLVSLVVLHVFRVMNTPLGIPIKLWLFSKGIYTHTLLHQKLQTILKGLLTPSKVHPWTPTLSSRETESTHRTTKLLLPRWQDDHLPRTAVRPMGIL